MVCICGDYVVFRLWCVFYIYKYIMYGCGCLYLSVLGRCVVVCFSIFGYGRICLFYVLRCFVSVYLLRYIHVSKNSGKCIHFAIVGNDVEVQNVNNKLNLQCKITVSLIKVNALRTFWKRILVNFGVCFFNGF